ncbi:MAG: hypothetical protein WBW48_24535 [Anaerolineae bacterium]
MAKGEQKKERKVAEFKFRSIGDRTRQRILVRLGGQKVELFLFILEKGDRIIADTPKNYARLVWQLLAECLKQYPKAPVIIDSHFDLAERREAFDAFIAEKAGRPVAITHGDSNLDAGVELADFLVGQSCIAVGKETAALRKCSGKK